MGALANMIALVSDLHANVEAFEAALRDIDPFSVESVVCLGDLVGYGASPREVLTLARDRCAFSLLGNHDAALLDDQDAAGFNERALLAIDWTRRTLDPEKEENWDLWDWLGSLVPAMVAPFYGEDVGFVHASPCQPLQEYLMPNAHKRPDQLAANFAAAETRITFFGHTHHPGSFVEGEAFVRAEGEDAVLVIDPKRRYLINVGSVGQPRDGDPRLGYALFDGETVRWRRISYDHGATRNRILQAQGLPDSLGDRLLQGR